MAFETVGGLRMHYETFGIPNKDSKLLFISGTGGDLRVRPGVLDTPLARDFEVLAFDQRGLGQTDKPNGPYTMAQYADDAAGLLAAVGWQDTLVIGVSFGGMVAQEFALRHPKRVRRLVLCCTSPGGEGGASYPLHELATLSVDERARHQIAVSDLRRDAKWQAANPTEVARLMEFASSAATVGANEPGKIEGARRQLEARRDHDTWSRLGALDMPVLLCAGRYDGIAPLANMEAMARRIRHSTLRVLDGGHLFLIQDRNAYPTIVQWLKSEGT